MHLCLFEDDRAAHLLPLVHTRAVYDLRLGIRTLLETTREAFGEPATLLHARRQVASVTGQEHGLLVNRIPEGLDVLFVNGRYIAEDGPVLELLRGAGRGREARAYVQGDEVVAAWVPGAASRFVEGEAVTRASFEGVAEEAVEGARMIGRLWHLLDELHPALLRDYAARTSGYKIYERPGARVHELALLVCGEDIFIGPGATVRPGAVLNAEDGPIYIAEEAVVMEHAVIRGPAFVGAHAQIKGASVIEQSAVGPWSKAGGEVIDTILHSYSNKVHDGYLGDAYLGRWCNIGAGAENSNLKNDYGPVTLHDAATGAYEETGRQFVGLFMGDHSKCGINTSFNTGTVVGVSCNLYGQAFMPRVVPSFSWGGPESGFTEYRLEKALRVAEAVMARRNTPLTDADREMLAAIFEATREERSRVVGGE